MNLHRMLLVTSLALALATGCAPSSRAVDAPVHARAARSEVVDLGAAGARAATSPAMLAATSERRSLRGRQTSLAVMRSERAYSHVRALRK